MGSGHNHDTGPTAATDLADANLVESEIDLAAQPEPTIRDGFEAVRASYPPILSTAQVAELLDLNPRTVLNMAGDGRLPASRLPGSRKFHFLLEEVIDTLKANRIHSG